MRPVSTTHLEETDGGGLKYRSKTEMKLPDSSRKITRSSGFYLVRISWNFLLGLL